MVLSLLADSGLGTRLGRQLYVRQTEKIYNFPCSKVRRSIVEAGSVWPGLGPGGAYGEWTRCLVLDCPSQSLFQGLQHAKELED